MAPPSDSFASPPPPPKGIVLALGGGAALGWAHIGVLRALAEEGVPIGAVAGTSIGAIAAVCLAGDRLDVLEGIATGATRGQVFGYLDPHLGRGAFLGGRRIARRLRQHLGDVRLEQLGLPISIVAADIGAREEVRLTTGPAIPAVQASIALPGLFRPVEIEGRVLVDGGMAACVPVGAARAIAPGSPVVAVSLLDIEPRVIPDGGRLTALQVMGAAFLTLMAQQTRAAFALDPPEVLIHPAIGHFSTGAFTHAAELITLGREAALAVLPEIKTALSAAQKSGRV